MSKKLQEACRLTQIALEQYRHDPDDEEAFDVYLREKQQRDTEWLKHATR
jgi:hypothetical protein